MLTGILILVFFVCFGMLWNEGTWSNAITLVNVLLSAILAFNYFEPVASYMDKTLPNFTYLWDYLSLWAVFGLSLIVLRAFTDKLSDTQVKFKMPVEQVGRILTSAAVGWIVICFFLATLHTAPLSRSPFKGGFQPEPMANSFFGMAPDRMWLGYMHKISSPEGGSLQSGAQFDPQGEFILKYGSRRQNFSENEAVLVDRSRQF